jgi:hypothetical protein
MESFFKTLFFVVLVGGILLFGWLLRDQWMPAVEAPVPVEVPTEAVAPAEDSGPRHPIEEPSILGIDGRDTRPLPTLDDSDGFFLLETGQVFGADVEDLLLRDGIIDRFVATVDNLPRKHVPEKIRPVGRLATEFVTEGTGPIVLSEDNFRRYDTLVAQVAAADLDDIADMYRRYYPLFQKSYEQLGYPDAYFNDRLIEVIDLMLATPEPTGPIALIQPNVLYEFIDPALEELASGQKLMLRIGPEHAATIKGMLRELRARLASDEYDSAE